MADSHQRASTIFKFKNNDWHISSLIEMKLPIELAEIISDKSKNKFTF